MDLFLVRLLIYTLKSTFHNFVKKMDLFGTIKVVPKHLVRVVIWNLRRAIVGVIVVCRLFESRRDWRLGRIDVQEHHVRVALLDSVWILVALGLVVLPIVPCHSDARTSSHFHRPRKSVVVDMVHIRLDSSYSARFSRHTIRLENTPFITS